MSSIKLKKLPKKRLQLRRPPKDKLSIKTDFNINFNVLCPKCNNPMIKLGDISWCPECIDKGLEAEEDV